MMFVSIGLPSGFAEWCDLIICALVRKTRGAFKLVSGNTCEEIALSAMRARLPHLVIGARQPTESLRRVLAQSGRRFVLALDDPRVALRNLVMRHDLEWKAAVRATAGSCASMISYEKMPGALILRADQHGHDLLATAAAIADWLEFEIPAAEFAELLQEQSDASAMRMVGELEPWWSTRSADDRSIAEGALNGYNDYFSDARMGPMVWARDLFFIGDDPHSATDRVIDVGGPIRNLLFGPYMTLPPGEWTATVVLALSKEAADLDYRVEVLAGPSCVCLGSRTILPSNEGVCETAVDFAVADATDQPISLRVANLRPAASGRLALGHVAVAPRQRTGAEIPAELTIALGLRAEHG